MTSEQNKQTNKQKAGKMNEKVCFHTRKDSKNIIKKYMWKNCMERLVWRVSFMSKSYWCVFLMEKKNRFVSIRDPNVIRTKWNSDRNKKQTKQNRLEKENEASRAPARSNTHHLLLPVELWRGCCLRPSAPGRCSSLRLLAARPWWSDHRWVRRRSGCWVAAAGWETAGSAQTINKEESGAVSRAKVPAEVRPMAETWEPYQASNYLTG